MLHTKAEIASLPVFRRHLPKFRACVIRRDRITLELFVDAGTPIRALFGGVVDRCIRRVFKKDGRRQHQITISRRLLNARGDEIGREFENYTGVDFRTYRVKKDRRIRAGKLLGCVDQGERVTVVLFRPSGPATIKFRKPRNRKKRT